MAAPGGEEAGSGECITVETFFLWRTEHRVQFKLHFYSEQNNIKVRFWNSSV